MARQSQAVLKRDARSAVGFEVVCRSFSCEHNDCPNCRLWVPGKAIVIDKGKCINYKKKIKKTAIFIQK